MALHGQMFDPEEDADYRNKTTEGETPSRPEKTHTYTYTLDPVLKLMRIFLD